MIRFYCDICGKEIVYDKERTELTIKSKGYKVIDSDFDMCQECVDKLHDFLKGEDLNNEL